MSSASITEEECQEYWRPHATQWLSVATQVLSTHPIHRTFYDGPYGIFLEFLGFLVRMVMKHNVSSELQGIWSADCLNLKLKYKFWWLYFMAKYNPQTKKFQMPHTVYCHRFWHCSQSGYGDQFTMHFKATVQKQLPLDSWLEYST